MVESQANLPAATGDWAARRRGVGLWLWLVAASVFLMVLVGGATRLTESGLSITEWKPITGIVPPLSAADWAEAFEKYKQIPQYRELFPNMDLAQFQAIYAWEWSHRLLGRLIGLVVFALPFLIFWLRGWLTDRLKIQLLGILALGGLQGFIGWWMVASGLDRRVEVAQERLAIHLTLACVTFAALVWIAAGLTLPRRRENVAKTAKFLSVVLIVITLAQIFLGGLVAGLRAGLIYNTWPLIEGRFIPDAAALFELTPWPRNFFDNLLTVQFQHRLTAYLLFGLALLNALVAKSAGVRRRGWVLAGLVFVQAGVGVATLLLVVPLGLALLHQSMAMIVLAMAVVNARIAFPAST